MTDSIIAFPNEGVDTLLQSGTLQDPDLALRPSVFTGHALPIRHSDPLPKPQTLDAWFFGLLFIGFVLFAWILSFNAKRLSQLFLATLNTNFFQRFRRNGGLYNEPMFLPQVLLMILCSTLFIYRLIDQYRPAWIEGVLEKNQIFWFLGTIASMVGLSLLVKVVWVKILAWVFKETQAAQTYLYNTFVFNGAGALVLLPLLLLAFFSEATVQMFVSKSILILYIVFVLWRAIRAFSIGYEQSRFPWIHQIVYYIFFEALCPALILLSLSVVSR